MELSICQSTGGAKEDDMSIGTQLRSIRKARGLSAAQLAELASISASMISQIERGVASPSIDALRRLSKALNVAMGVFFESPSEDGVSIDDRENATPSLEAGNETNGTVIQTDERIRLSLPKSNVVYEMCTPLSHRELQAIWMVLGPKEAGPDEPFSHPGKEVNLVLSGQLAVIVDGEEFLLGPGSCISFDGHLPHRLMNHADEPAAVYSVISPAAY